MDQKLSYIINGILGATIELLGYCRELERYNRQLNDDKIIELQKTVDKLGSNKTLEEIILK